MSARLLALTLTAVVLSSCGGSTPAGAPAPTAMTGPALSEGVSTPSASAVATPLVTPATSPGALAVVREYYRRLDAAYQDGMTQGVAVLRTATCTCVSTEMHIRAFAKQGEHLEGFAHEITAIQMVASAPAYKRFLIALHGPMSRVMKGGTQVGTDSASAGTNLMTLLRSGDRWQVSEVVVDVHPASR